MNATVRECLAQIRLGEPQAYETLQVFPLHISDCPAFDCITLDEALDDGLLTVEEVSETGSVSELAVSNKAAQPVLLLEGEELEGAKQNRVLNTTILVPAETAIVVPVSCSEQGRWKLNTMTLRSSRAMMGASGRSTKVGSVSLSLRNLQMARSNQGAVWKRISLQLKQGSVKSPTGALKDLIDQRKEKLDACARAMAPADDQCGLLAAIDGEIAGFDLVPVAGLYARYHNRLVRSYGLDSVLHQRDAGKRVSRPDAEAFLTQTSLCKEEHYPSDGLGQDWRYTSSGQTGFALVHDDRVIHTAFLRAVPEPAKPRLRLGNLRRVQGNRDRRDED